MKTLLGRSAVVALLGLLVILAASGWRGRAKARYAAAVLRATEDCRAYRTQPGHEHAPACHYDEFEPTTPVNVHLGETKLHDARVALARGDARGASNDLRDAVNDAQRADRFGTVMGAVHAAAVIDAVVDVLDANRSQLDAEARRNVLANAHLETASAPFERERVTRLWVLAHFEQLKFPDVPSNEADLGSEMETAEPAFREMQRALLRGDVNACERAASRVGEHSHPPVQVHTCKLLGEVVRVERRVRSAT